MNSLVLASLLCLWVGDNTQYSIEIDVVHNGPRTEYSGCVWLHSTAEQRYPCFDYSMQLPKGRIAGPVISSQPGEPMIVFPWTVTSENQMHFWRCYFPSAAMQVPSNLPISFVFYVIQDEFDGEDLEKLLADWGSDNSPWDLDLDGRVSGSDLTLLLAGWDNNGGTP